MLPELRLCAAEVTTVTVLDGAAASLMVLMETAAPLGFPLIGLKLVTLGNWYIPS